MRAHVEAESHDAAHFTWSDLHGNVLSGELEYWAISLQRQVAANLDWETRILLVRRVRTSADEKGRTSLLSGDVGAVRNAAYLIEQDMRLAETTYKTKVATCLAEPVPRVLNSRQTITLPQDIVMWLKKETVYQAFFGIDIQNDTKDIINELEAVKKGARW